MTAKTRYAVLIVLGVVIWFVAAMCIRFGLLAGWHESPRALAAVFALSLPGSMLGIELIHRIVGGAKGEMVRTAAVIALVGAMMDGLAISWTPLLYTPDRAALSFGGAWLLWIVGAILAYGLVRDRR